jgi:hypothetical protein
MNYIIAIRSMKKNPPDEKGGKGSSKNGWIRTTDLQDFSPYEVAADLKEVLMVWVWRILLSYGPYI